MLINISAIKDQHGASVQESLQENLNLELPGSAGLIGLVSISAEVTHAGETFHVQGKVSGNFQAECDRCLSGFKAPFQNEFQGEFVRVHSAGKNSAKADFGSERELPSAEESDYYQFQGDVIDLTELVSEAIILAIPMKYLCRTDCQGLCPCCGTPKEGESCGCEVEEINPKFEALRKLLGREEV